MYYFYTGLWYRILSPNKWQGYFSVMNIIDGDGRIYEHGISNVGGVHIQELCYYVFLGRGWINDKDSGTNTNYYLYSKEWYRTISPMVCLLYNNSFIITVQNTAEIDSFVVLNSSGVLQPYFSIRIML